MASFKFSCPHCGKHVEAEEEWEGMEAECPHCGKIIVIHNEKILYHEQTALSNKFSVKQNKSRKYKLIIVGIVCLGTIIICSVIWNHFFISKPSSSTEILQPDVSSNGMHLKQDSLFSINNGKILTAFGVKLNEKNKVDLEQLPGSSRIGILGDLLNEFPREKSFGRKIGYGDAAVSIYTNYTVGSVSPWGIATFFITYEEKSKEVLAIEAVFENSNDSVYREIIERIETTLKKSNIVYKTMMNDGVVSYTFNDAEGGVFVAKNYKTRNFDPVVQLITGTYNHHILIFGTEIQNALNSREIITPQDRYEKIDTHNDDNAIVAYGFKLGYEPHPNELWQIDERLERALQAQGQKNIRVFEGRGDGGDQFRCFVRMTPVTRKAYSVEIIFKVRRNGSLSNTLAPVLQNARERFHISSEEIKKYDTSDEIYYSVLRPNVSISLYGHLDGNYVVVKIVITDDELKKEQ